MSHRIIVTEHEAGYGHRILYSTTFDTRAEADKRINLINTFGDQAYRLRAILANEGDDDLYKNLDTGLRGR